MVKTMPFYHFTAKNAGIFGESLRSERNFWLKAELSKEKSLFQ